MMRRQPATCGDRFRRGPAVMPELTVRVEMARHAVADGVVTGCPSDGQSTPDAARRRAYDRPEGLAFVPTSRPSRGERSWSKQRSDSPHVYSFRDQGVEFVIAPIGLRAATAGHGGVVAVGATSRPMIAYCRSDARGSLSRATAASTGMDASGDLRRASLAAALRPGRPDGLSRG